MDIFKNLSAMLAGNRPYVFLSVTPGVGLEMIQVEVGPNPTVKNYAVRPLAYNDSLREIANMEDFKKAVGELFDELNVNPKCNITLNLPTVLFGSTELSLMIGDEGAGQAILSEIEQSYLFKRHDALFKFWDSNVGSGELRKVFYAAVQQDIIDNIKETLLTEFGANLVGVEMGLLSTLRALDLTGLVSDQMKDGIIWNLLTVTANGYTILSMRGKQIIDYYEEPIAVKSYEGDEIYNVINSSAQITLMSYPANYLVVVSDADTVSAEMLTKNINVDCPCLYFENNKFKREEFLPVSLDVLQDNKLKISLQAIGVAVSRTSDYPVYCNFLQQEEAVVTEETIVLPIGETGFKITPTQALIVSGIFLAVVVGIPFLISDVVLPQHIKKQQLAYDELDASNKQLEEQKKALEEQTKTSGKFSVKSEMLKVLASNRVKLMAYSAIGEAVPAKLWLTHFNTEGNGKITIEGSASTVEEIYLFYKNVKDSLPTSDLKLNKLEMASDDMDEFVANRPVLYEFQISNVVAPIQAVAEDGKSGDSKDANSKGANDKNANTNANTNSNSGKATGSAAGVAPDSKLLSDEPIN